jgi:hypothetical protein
VWRTQKAGRVFYAIFCRHHEQLGFNLLLGLVDSKTQRFRAVDGIVEDGRSAEGAVAVHVRFRHCAGARMHSGGVVMSRSTPKTCNRNREQRSVELGFSLGASGLAARRRLAMCRSVQAEQWQAAGRASRKSQ